MDSNTMIIYMIIACLIFIGLVLLSKSIKYIIKFFVQALFGALGFFIANSLLISFNLFVGINLITVLTVGLLGLPGFIMLYVASNLVK